jgi:hypothetical protein
LTGEAEEIHENLKHDARYLCQNSNGAATELKKEALLLKPACPLSGSCEKSGASSYYLGEVNGIYIGLLFFSLMVETESTV